jgi:general stress protein 26
LSIGNAFAATDSPSDTEVLEVARKIMISSRYCALVTLDAVGNPQVRAMDPFPPDRDMVVRMATHRSTRKIAQIVRNSRVALYYFDSEGKSYVTISGVARLIEDPAQKSEWWKPEWEPFYEDSYRGEDFVLIEVVAKRCEVMSIEHKIASAAKSWKPAVVEIP